MFPIGRRAALVIPAKAGTWTPASAGVTVRRLTAKASGPKGLIISGVFFGTDKSVPFHRTPNRENKVIRQTLKADAVYSGK
jgi:hypothetical protein